MKWWVSVGSVLLLMLFMRWANADNQIPSCYAANRLDIAAPVPTRDVYIMLDQTTVLYPELKQALAAIMRDLIQPGTAFTIVRFSAFSQGHYMEVVASGALENKLDEDSRDTVGARVLKNFDSCMKKQVGYGVRLAFDAVGKTLGGSSNELARSDLIASIAEGSRIVKASQVPRRIVLIVSDMVENSSIASFYAKNNLRLIDPEKELATVERNRLFGDFGGASVYVMGAGLIPEVKTKAPRAPASAYRDPKTLGALKTFWAGYFQRSNADLREIGTPALLVTVQ